MLAAVRPILASAGRNPPLVARVVVATPPERASPDRVALDRRGGPRRPDVEPVVDRFTASTHRPLPLVLGIGAAGRWALVKGLSLAPGDVLVHLVDTTDRELDPRDRIGAAVWMRLARHVHPRRVPSPLWLSSSCVQAPALIAELARRSTTATRVELVPLVRHGDALPLPLEPRCLAGVLVPLCDPRPTVLGIALGEIELAHLGALLRAASPPHVGVAAGAGTPRMRAIVRDRSVGEPLPAAPAATAPRPRSSKSSRGKRARAKPAAPLTAGRSEPPREVGGARPVRARAD